MKTIFILNPCAGQGVNVEKTTEFIKESCKHIDEEFNFYITKSVGDATDYVKKYCINSGPARFIACGGDGTLSEVINGIIDLPGCQVGVMPCGTGNDFHRNFTVSSSFRDAISQIKGDTTPCDAIKYTTSVNGEIITKYCANMINIGFDCNVADMTGQMKKKPFISGSVAYYLSILAKLIKKDGANLKIEADDTEIHSGALLLTSVANGCYCGGGIKSNPNANVNDGFLNVNIVNNVSRTKFIKLLPHYIKGDFLDIKDIDSIVRTFSCKKLTVTPLDGTMRICNDGEIYDAEKTEFEIVHNAFEFVIPNATGTKKVYISVK